MIKNHPLGHLKISSGSLTSFGKAIAKAIYEKKKSYAMPLNLTKYIVSQKDSKLKQTISEASWVIADGVPIVWLSRRMGYSKVRRVTGIELAEWILEESAKRNWRIFLLGSHSEVLSDLLSKIDAKFSSPLIVGSHHGYFKKKEIPFLLEEIKRKQADILFLGLGMPQKEYFLYDHFAKLQVPFALPVGGAFDIWSERKTRTPRLLQQLGLEWFYRSFYDYRKATNIIRYGIRFLKDLLFGGKPQ